MALQAISIIEPHDPKVLFVGVHGNIKLKKK
jgi:hypothetical protein